MSLSISDCKPREERVKETITLLKRMLELGIPATEPGYKMLKEKFRDWCKEDGEAWIGEVYFPRFGRRAEVVLPIQKDRAATVNILKPGM